MSILSTQKQMEHQAEAIHALASGLTAEEIKWKPDPESWSVLEVLNHLVHEEVNDFRRYLEHIITLPNDPWPEFHPLENSADVEDPQQCLQERLASFQSEREKSLTWLGTLTDVDWDAEGDTPWGGKMSAGDMLASWLAHDILHLRQLVELRYALTAAACQPYGVDYAGEW